MEAGHEHVEALEPDRYRVALTGAVTVVEAEHFERGARFVERGADVTSGAGRFPETPGAQRDEARGAERGRGPREGHQRERGDTTARPTVFTSAPNQIESVAGS